MGKQRESRGPRADAAAAFCAVAVLFSTAGSAADWPQYRGPDSLGQAVAAGVFERPEAVGLKVAWRKPLGSGYSGIAVAGGRVVSMFAGDPSDVLAAFDERSGKLLWRHELGSRYAGHDGSHDGPLSTPLIAGDKIVGLSAAGRLFAVRAATGEALWSVDLVAEHNAVVPGYGFAASPILVDGVLLLQVGSADATLAGFSLDTGKRLWAAGTDQVQYQTPVVVRQGKASIVIAAGMQKLYGIDPKSGRILWEHAHDGGGGGYGAPGLTPLPVGDGLLFLAHKDEAGKVVRLPAEGAGGELETVWENRNIRHSYATPVYHEGYIYAFSARFLTCVDAATGEPRWRSREPGDGWLSLVDGHLVIATKEGGLHIARADPGGYREVAGLDVFDSLVWSAPSFADGHIYARSLDEIARIDIGGGRTFPERRTPGGANDIANTRLGALLREVAAADNKRAIVDRFMQSVESFPLIEGRDRVHFLYRGAAEDVAVAGDLFGVSLETPMTRVPGTDLFYHSMLLEPDARVNYVLIEDYKQIPDPRNPRRAESVVVTEDMELSFSGQAIEMSWFAMPAWKEPNFLTPPAEARRGRVEAHGFDSAIAGGKATIDVYLPAGYDAGERRYPVAYVHGGAAARERGAWPTALDNLIGDRVAPLIVVFIGPLRLQRPDYAKLFAEELVPYVDAQFRTVPEPGARASVGAGFGGVNAFFCAFLNTGLVGKVATQSAFMLEFAWEPLLPLIKTAQEAPLDLYLDWGTYDLRNRHEAWDLGEANRRVSDYLRSRGYAPAGGEVHDGAGWTNWRNRTGALLQAIFPISSPG